VGISLGDIDASQAPDSPDAARIARAGIGTFPVETPDQRQAAAQAQLALLQKEAEADPALANDPSHQREIKRSAELAAGTPAKVTMTSGERAAPDAPTWEEVRNLPEMKALPSHELELARQQYFADVVLPLVPLGQATEARAAFDADTKPGPLQRAVGADGDAVRRSARTASPTGRGSNLSLSTQSWTSSSAAIGVEAERQCHGLVYDRRMLDVFNRIDAGRGGTGEG
jgi:hypothetical protein